MEKPVYAYAVATKVEKPVYAVATKAETPVCAIATKVEKPVCAIEIDEPDFCVSFDASEKAWTVTWKWSDDAEHHALGNRVTEYSIPTSARLSYEAEIEEWTTNGWLEPYDDEKLGPAKGLIPLMAIIQQNKDKVRPVMDFRELNSQVDAFTANADVCADKIREWQRLGTNVAIVDLRRAYLQIRIPVVLPDCDLSWSKVLPREVGVWIECGAQCDEVCAYRGAGAGRNCRLRHLVLPR